MFELIGAPNSPTHLFFTGPFSLGEGPEVGVPAISMAGTTPHLNFSFTASYTNIPNYYLFIKTTNLVRCQKIQFINTLGEHHSQKLTPGSLFIMDSSENNQLLNRPLETEDVSDTNTIVNENENRISMNLELQRIRDIFPVTTSENNTLPNQNGLGHVNQEIVSEKEGAESRPNHSTLMRELQNLASINPPGLGENPGLFRSTRKPKPTLRELRPVFECSADQAWEIINELPKSREGPVLPEEVPIIKDNFGRLKFRINLAQDYASQIMELLASQGASAEAQESGTEVANLNQKLANFRHDYDDMTAEKF